MADQVMMALTFTKHKIQIVKGDKETHVFKCPHTTVEIVDNETGDVVHAYLFEHTHYMNELEAWWKFGGLCMAEAERDGRTNVAAQILPKS
jgi:hypothetical protein